MATLNESASQIFEKVGGLLRNWLSEEGAKKVDFEYVAVALTSTYVCWLELDGNWSRIHLPSEISFAMHDLRAAQADPRRGAWLWSHLWMEASEGVLHQECDWMREPVIDDDEPVMDGDAALELDYFPRDPDWIPEWMATKAAAHQKVRDAREHRRQRDRERRAKQKAEADQAEEASGSGRSGE